MSHHVSENLRNHTISNPNSTIHLDRPIQSLSNPLAIISPYLLCEPFCLTFHVLRSKMTRLYDLAQYRNNPYGHQTRPSIMSYSGPCGNCHCKDTSPTTDDRTQLPPRTKENHRPSMPIRIWTVISNDLSIWEYCTKIQSHTHGPLQSIQITEVKPSYSTKTKP